MTTERTPDYGLFIDILLTLIGKHNAWVKRFSISGVQSWKQQTLQNLDQNADPCGLECKAAAPPRDYLGYNVVIVRRRGDKLFV